MPITARFFSQACPQMRLFWLQGVQVIKNIAQLCVGQQLAGNRNHSEIVSQLDEPSDGTFLLL